MKQKAYFEMILISIGKVKFNNSEQHEFGAHAAR